MKILADAYNRGGFSDQDIQQVSLGPDDES